MDAASDFVVGDIVVLGGSVGKRFQQQEAQVINITPKMPVVSVHSGKEKASKTFATSVCKIVQPSVLRST